jgi:hypothetical protein
MKIAGEKIDIKSADRTQDESDSIELQIENGNIIRARRLGSAVVSVIQSETDKLGEGGIIASLDMKDTMLIQYRMLMIFTVVSTIEQHSPNKHIMRTALNTFYDILKREDPEIYDYMSASGASSFYYLAIRRGGDCAANVGKSFAMLCEREDDGQFIAAGSEIYSHYRRRTLEMIEGNKFVV